MIKTYDLFIKDDDVASFCHLKEEAKMWKKLAEENEAQVKMWKKLAVENKAKVNQLLEDMANDYSTYIDEIKEKEMLLQQAMSGKVNKGKPIHEVGKKQAKRKMKILTEKTKMALLFAETFGLMPHKVIMKSPSGDSVS